MARPVHVSISSGLAAWDGEVDDNFDLVFDTPFAIVQYSTFANLPTASDYEECLALVSDEDTLCISDGSSWKRLGGGAPPVYANVAGLPAASGHTDEIAVIQDLDILVISDGSNWKLIGTQAADISALTGSPGGSATDTLAVSLVTAKTGLTVGTASHSDTTLPTARTGPTVGTAGNHSDTSLPAARTGSVGGTAGNYVSITDPADSPATADALRDDLVANAIAEIRTNQTTFSTDLDSVRAMLAILQNDVRTFATDAAAVRTMLVSVQDSIKTFYDQMIELTQTGGLQEDIRDNLQALTTKVNLIRTNLRATDLMA